MLVCIGQALLRNSDGGMANGRFVQAERKLEERKPTVLFAMPLRTIWTRLKTIPSKEWTITQVEWTFKSHGKLLNGSAYLNRRTHWWVFTR